MVHCDHCIFLWKICDLGRSFKVVQFSNGVCRQRGDLYSSYCCEVTSIESRLHDAASVLVLDLNKVTSVILECFRWMCRLREYRQLVDGCLLRDPIPFHIVIVLLQCDALLGKNGCFNRWLRNIICSFAIWCMGQCIGCDVLVDPERSDTSSFLCEQNFDIIISANGVIGNEDCYVDDLETCTGGSDVDVIIEKLHSLYISL